MWDQSFDGITNIVDVYVRHLRSKVDDPYEQKLIVVLCAASATASATERTREYSIAPFPHHGLVCGASRGRAADFWRIGLPLGLERYLYWNLQRTLGSDCRTIGTQLLTQHPFKRTNWLETEINEAYAPEVNGHFIRVVQEGVGVLYVSGAPKGRRIRPVSSPFAQRRRKKSSAKSTFSWTESQLLIDTQQFTTPDGSKFVVESGVPYQQIEVVLHGLLVTFAIYMPFIISLAVVSGYWLMRRSLQPVDEITKRAEGITSTNLSERLPVICTGDELERLSVFTEPHDRAAGSGFSAHQPLFRGRVPRIADAFDDSSVGA